MKPTLEELGERDLVQPARAAAQVHGTSLEAMCSRDRHKAPARARAAFWAWLRRELGWSYPTIGALFGRTHSNVLKVLRRHPVEVA